jgi:transcriptional regulator with XRE-family HTH domain
VESVAPESLGQKIRNRRLELNLTQREVADAVGITVPYMSKIEAGKETPTDEKIARLATKLKLNPDELTLAAGRMPSDVMDRLVADPTRALEFMRKVRR